jgi:hypothetical protein
MKTNDIWGLGPIHSKVESYGKMADGVMTISMSMESGARRKGPRVPTALRLETVGLHQFTGRG